MNHSPSGRILHLSTGYDAFMPEALPPKLEWTTALVNALSSADHCLGKLAGEGGKLPNPHVLMRPFVMREAVLSSKIEGTEATLGEILAVDAGGTVERSPDELKEIRNYIAALEYGLKRLETLPLSLRLLREIHEKLMGGVRGQHATPGEFRRSQNWIGPAGCTLATANYIPPPSDKLIECLGEFEKFLHDHTFPALIHAALCHYQFEAIHPFLDGNGRIGRLLITLLLVERKILPSPLLYLSAFFEASRDAYYAHLFHISSRAAWTDWLIYFLNGVAIQSSDVLSRAERINQLISQWRLKVSGLSTPLPARIVECLAVNPFLTINKITREFNIVFTTAQRAIKKLESLGIVSQAGKARRDRVYCAVEILNILEEPAKIYVDPPENIG